MIKSLSISNLFGRFNYKINLKPEGVTIITGPNGYGKSTILKIINALANIDLPFFFELDFTDIIVCFIETSTSIDIKKSNPDAILIDTLAFNKKQFGDNKHNNYIRQVGPHTWMDMRTRRVIDPDDMMFLNFYDELYENEFKSNNTKNNKYKLLNDKLSQIKDLCGSVRLISEQRLIKKNQSSNNRDDHVIDVIKELPTKLRTEISKVYEEYSSVANELDSSYPKRLFAQSQGLKDKYEFEKLLDEANKRFSKLSDYKLVDMQIIDTHEYIEKYSTALKIYFDDFSIKYQVFENLIIKMDLFTSIINKLLSFKKIQISRSEGFEILDLDTPKNLQLAQLSSGEKQVIVLFYDLIFDTKKDLLLLLDEPEISLHIVWQKQFLNDLLKVVSSTNTHVIVATHSPQLISDHWDMQIDLGEEYGK